MSKVNPEDVQFQADLDVAEYQLRQREIEAEEQWQELCNLQAWDEVTQVEHLEGFLRENQLFSKFSAFALQCANEENEDKAFSMRLRADEIQNRLNNPYFQVH